MTGMRNDDWMGFVIDLGKGAIIGTLLVLIVLWPWWTG